MTVMEYGILFNEKYNMNTESEDEIQIGKIIEMENMIDVMYLYYSKNEYKESGLHFHVLISDFADGKTYPMVIMDDFYKDLFYNKTNIFFALALHELGHYLNGDLDSGQDKDEIMMLRTKSIIQGKVIDMEAKADEFAVKQVGKSCFNRALDLLIQRRKERNDVGKELAIKEFELRKNNIKKMKI